MNTKLKAVMCGLTRQMAAMLEAAIDGSANAGLALMRSRFGERVEIPTLPGDQLGAYAKTAGYSTDVLR